MFKNPKSFENEMDQEKKKRNISPSYWLVDQMLLMVQDQSFRSVNWVRISVTCWLSIGKWVSMVNGETIDRNSLKVR